jgi:Uncharacterized protein conserved in bacteria
MSDIRQYIKKRKTRDQGFAYKFDIGYEEFKLGVMLRQAREEAGLTQAQLAKKIGYKKISDIPHGKPCRRHPFIYLGEICAGSGENTQAQDWMTVYWPESSPGT